MRRLSLPLAAALCLIWATAAAAVPASAPTRAPAGPTSFQKALLQEVNAARAGNGVRALRLSPLLGRGASRHARALVSHGTFSHTSPDGTGFAARIRRIYPARVVGETILWRSPRATPSQTIGTWLASPPHRAVILHGGFREVGIGVVQVASAPGVYGGRPVTVIVVDFGARR